MTSKPLLLRLLPEERVHWQGWESLGSLWEVALGQAEGTATPVYDFQWVQAQPSFPGQTPAFGSGKGLQC